MSAYRRARLRSPSNRQSRSEVEPRLPGPGSIGNASKDRSGGTRCDPAQGGKPKLPRFLYGGSSYRSQRKVVVQALIVARNWLAQRHGAAELKVSLLYHEFESAYRLVRAFVERWGGNRSDRDKLRRALFKDAGIPHRRPPTYRVLTKQSIIQLCRKNGWSRISQLPPKLLALIYERRWQDAVALRVPFSYRLFDAAGRFCHSRYELIARNILYDVKSVPFEVEKRYPGGSRERCDIWLTLPEVWIEIWGFRLNVAHTRKSSSKVWKVLPDTYRKNRQEKTRNRLELRLRWCDIEVCRKNGRPKSPFEFAQDFIAALSRFISFPARFHDAAWVRRRVANWQKSSAKPRETATRQALSRLKRCERALAISGSTDWLRICERTVCNTPLQRAAQSAGVPSGALSGIARLKDGGWQYTGPFNGERARFSDSAYGSSLVALSFAVKRLTADRRLARRTVEEFPALIQEYLMSGPRIGVTGVAFFGFRPHQRRHRTRKRVRPSDYDTFVSSPILIKLKLSAKVRGVSLKQRGAYHAAVEFLQWLAPVCGDLLILDQRLGRSRLVAKRRVASSIWVLQRPTSEEIAQVARRVLRRLGLEARR